MSGTKYSAGQGSSGSGSSAPKFSIRGSAGGKLLRGKSLVYLLGILLTVFVAWLQLLPPGGAASLIRRIDNVIYDQRFNLMPRPVRDYDNKIVVVDIDERSLQAEGQWPWDRFRLGRLLERLEEYGVLVTGFDITFPEPQRNPVRDLLEHTGQEGPIDARLQALSEELDADSYFAEVIGSSSMDIVMALSFHPLEEMRYGALPESIVSIEKSIADTLTLQEMAGYTSNIAVLQEAATGAGHMNQRPDLDGVVRRVPLVVRYGDELYPTLALEMARLYFFEDSFDLLTYETGNGHIIEGIRVGDRAGQYELRTDRMAQVLVPFVGRSHLSGTKFYPYVSATDVLNGTADPEILRDALVLIGSTATGIFDLRSTPLEAIYPGVEVHANILNGLLASFVVQEVGAATEAGNSLHFPSRPDWEQGAVFLVIVAAGLLLSFVLPVMGPALLVLVTVLLVVLAVWLNFMLWSSYKLDISLALILLLILLLGALNMAFGFLSERLSRKTIKGMFDQYVPPAHIDAMLRNPESYSFAGESREMTVLFSDIRNFTSISESLTATELKELLNDFFTPVTEIIFANNGTIDKYVGDMVMAFWGAPLRDQAHRSNAVHASLQMLSRVDALQDEFQRRGLPAVNIGIGVNTGVMNVGDMGSVYRRSYTVLGDAVNLGSRLESLTKYYGVRCLIGENTFQGLEGFLCRLVDRMKVKGKDRPVNAYEPVCELPEATPQLQQQVQAWNDFMRLYFLQQWDQAERALQTLEESGSVPHLAGIYRERISILRTQSPGAEWDGAFVHESK